MIKRSLKYFLIAGVNAVILTVLLAIWTDTLELEFNAFVRPLEFLKIIGLSLVSLIAMRILVGAVNKTAKHHLAKKKITFSIVLTLALSTPLYLTYTINSYNTLFDKTRHSLIEKIESHHFLAHGTKADSLTLEEYSILVDIASFPVLPETADKICYHYSYDGFLPDYGFSLTYQVPIDMEIEEINYTKGTYSKSQSTKIIGDKKLVIYEEGLW